MNRDRLCLLITNTLMVLVSFVIVAVTDVGISAVLTYCTHLQEANFAGIKQITSDNFLPIISGKCCEQNLPRIQYENATVTEIYKDLLLYQQKFSDGREVRLYSG